MRMETRCESSYKIIKMKPIHNREVPRLRQHFGCESSYKIIKMKPIHNIRALNAINDKL